MRQVYAMPFHLVGFCTTENKGRFHGREEEQTLRLLFAKSGKAFLEGWTYVAGSHCDRVSHVFHYVFPNGRARKVVNLEPDARGHEGWENTVPGPAAL